LSGRGNVRGDMSEEGNVLHSGEQQKNAGAALAVGLLVFLPFFNMSVSMNTVPKMTEVTAQALNTQKYSWGRNVPKK